MRRSRQRQCRTPEPRSPCIARIRNRTCMHPQHVYRPTQKPSRSYVAESMVRSLYTNNQWSGDGWHLEDMMILTIRSGSDGVQCSLPNIHHVYKHM